MLLKSMIGEVEEPNSLQRIVDFGSNLLTVMNGTVETREINGWYTWMHSVCFVVENV